LATLLIYLAKPPIMSDKASESLSESDLVPKQKAAKSV
jgi:hypothetical protein